MTEDTKKVGRPAIEITTTAISQIEDLAGRGATLHNIALMLDISDSTLDRWMAEPKVKRAYQRGRLIATDAIAGSLYQMAMDGEVAAAIFWLKAQAGWNDRPAQEVPAGSQVVFYLPDNGRGGNANPIEA